MRKNLLVKNFILFAIFTCILILSGSFVLAEERTPSEEAVAAQVAMDYETALSLYQSEYPNADEHDAFVRLCSNWDLSDSEDDLLSKSYVFRDTGEGKLYQNQLAQCMVYVPNEITKDTKWGLFYPGGTGGWTLESGFVGIYVENFKPNAIYVFMGGPGIYGLDDESIQEQTAKVIKSVSKELGVAPNKIAVTGFSNGGYTALYGANYLYDKYGVGLEKVCLLDIGQNWGKTEILITEEEAKPMLESGVTVYQFGRAGEANVMEGAQQFASYGIPLVEIACGNGNHIEIFKSAMQNGMMSWAVGKTDELDKASYPSSQNINF